MAKKPRIQGSNGRSRSRSTKSSGGGGSGGGKSSSSRSKGSGDKSSGSGKSDRGKSRRKRDDNGGGGGGGGGTGEKSSKSTPSSGERESSQPIYYTLLKQSQLQRSPGYNVFDAADVNQFSERRVVASSALAQSFGVIVAPRSFQSAKAGRPRPPESSRLLAIIIRWSAERPFARRRSRARPAPGDCSRRRPGGGRRRRQLRDPTH